MSDYDTFDDDEEEMPKKSHAHADADTHVDYTNGADSGSNRRSGDPTTAYGIAFRIFERYGILAIICGALMYGNWKILQFHRADTFSAHKEFGEAMHEQTQAIKEMVATQANTNLLLQKHLDEDHPGHPDHRPR